MIWQRDFLWAKSKLFFERAFAEPPESPLFGLWCSLGLELLARTAISSVSPTLLAKPDPEHKFLLHALNRAAEKAPQSIGAFVVFNLCKTLFDSFSADDHTAALALVNRRNAELHSAAAAFDEYSSKIWLPGFYRICNSLVGVLGESLESLFGNDEAKIATEILNETKHKATAHVESEIAAHKRVFAAKSAEEQQAAAKFATKEAAQLTHERHHRVSCPACGCDALVQGQLFGPERVSHENGEIVVRQSVSPRSFSCSGCGLKLNGYAELDAAKLGGNYTRKKTFDPEDYYGLIDPETADLTPYIESYLADMAGERSWDNE